LLRGRGGGGRKPIKRPRNGGISNRSSGNGSSNASLPSAMRACATGLTITAVAHGISGRFLTLHPTNRHVAQQKRKNCEEPRANTAKDRTGVSVILSQRVAIRCRTFDPGRHPK